MKRIPWKNTRKRRHSLFASLLASVLCVALAPLSAGIIVAVNSQRTLRMQESANLGKLSSYLHKLDQIYGNVYSQVMKMTSDALITDYLRSQQRNYYTEYRISLQLSSAISNVRSISSVFLHLPQYDYIIYAEGGLPSEYFYRRRYDFGYSQWLTSLQPGTSSIALRYWKGKDAGANPACHALKTLPVNVKNGTAPVICAQVSAAELLAEMERLDFGENGGLTLLCAEGVLASTLPPEDSAVLYAFLLSGVLGEETAIQMKQKTYSLRTMNLDKYGLTAVYTVSNALISPHVLQLRYLSIYTVVLCGALTVVLGWLFSSSHARRIRKIMGLLDPQWVGKADGYAAMENLVQDQMLHYNQIKEMVSEHAEPLFQHFFHKVIHGDEHDGRIILSTFHLYGKPLVHPWYAIAVLEEDLCLSEPCAGFPQVLADLGGVLLHSQVAEGHTVCLLGFGQAMDSAGLLEAICASLEKRCVGISVCWQDFAHMRTAYRDALAAFTEQRSQIARDKEMTPRWVADCYAVIEKQYMNKGLSTSDVADQLGQSRSYLSMQFKQHLGVGLHEEIQRYRVERACDLLRGQMGLQDVADQSGFSSVESLIRNFKKYKGTTPGTYKQQFGKTKESPLRSAPGNR